MLADRYPLEDSVATHFAVMGSLPGLRVAGALGTWPATDERLAAAGATAVVPLEMVVKARDALESAGSREPMAMTAITVMMARLRSSSVTMGACLLSMPRRRSVDRHLAAHESHLPWLGPTPGPRNIPVNDRMSEIDTLRTKKARTSYRSIRSAR